MRMSDSDTATRDLSEMARRIRKLERMNSDLIRTNRDLAKAIASSREDEEPGTEHRKVIPIGDIHLCTPPTDGWPGNDLAPSLTTGAEEVLDAEGYGCGWILKGEMKGPGLNTDLLDIFKEFIGTFGNLVEDFPDSAAVLSMDRLPEGTEEYSLKDGIMFVTSRNRDSLIRKVRADLVRRNGPRAGEDTGEKKTMNPSAPFHGSGGDHTPVAETYGARQDSGCPSATDRRTRRSGSIYLLPWTTTSSAVKGNTSCGQNESRAVSPSFVTLYLFDVPIGSIRPFACHFAM